YRLAGPLLVARLRLVSRREKIQRDHPAFPLLDRIVRPERAAARVAGLAPAADGIDAVGQPRLLIGLQIEEIGAFIVVVVQAAPERRQPLLPVEEVLGDALPLCGRADKGTRQERLLVADLE